MDNGTMHKVLYGTYANSPCGKCHKHNVEITWTQVQGRKCLKKQCWHLERYPEHEAWKQHALKKQRRKARKQALKEKIGGR